MGNNLHRNTPLYTFDRFKDKGTGGLILSCGNSQNGIGAVFICCQCKKGFTGRQPYIASAKGICGSYDKLPVLIQIGAVGGKGLLRGLVYGCNRPSV